MIHFRKLKIPDLLIIEPQVFEDERGFFFESYNKKEFDEAIGRKITFVQDNHSKSTKGVLRGLHYQSDPHSQGKLVRVISGEIFDVAIDIRKNSETFGLWVAEILSEKNKKQLWIPEGFAHGFLALSEFAEVCYKTNNFYNKSSEVSLNPFDKKISIDWPKLNEPFKLNEKDLKGKNIDDKKTDIY